MNLNSKSLEKHLQKSNEKMLNFKFLLKKWVVRLTSGTNNADLGPVAFCMAVRISSSVKSSHGSTSFKVALSYIIRFKVTTSEEMNRSNRVPRLHSIKY